MSLLHVKYLLIGGGVASGAAAQAIRVLDARGDIMMVGLENVRPYNRPPLSKEYLRRKTERQGTFTMPVGWFSDNRVQLRTGLRASQLDVVRRVVTLESGEGVSYDQLLLATGTSPLHLKVPGAELPNVYYLRTLDDADRLHHAIEKAKHEGLRHDRGRGRVAVVGAGVLGVELAGTFVELGLGVDLLSSKPHPWHKFAGEHTGKFLALYLEKHGVRVHLAARPQRLEGDGRVQRVILDDAMAPLPCDFVTAAIGAIPNRELLRNTPISAEKAILVDQTCRTNVPEVFAAGDCAAVFDPLFGKHRVLDHLENAAVTGQIAGTNMAGGEARYDVVNSFESAVFDLTLRAWGEPRQVDRRLIRGSTSVEAPNFVEIGIAADGRVAQVLAISHPGEDQVLRDLVGQRVRVNGNEEALKDPAFPLQSLLS